MRYGVIGAGRQGTAAAYDMAKWGDAELVLLADRSIDVARGASERINRLVGQDVARGAEIDVAAQEELIDLVSPLDAFLCATPYAFIPACTRVAIEAGTGMVDLGGHTPTVLRQLQLDEDARDAGIAVVPDCGMGPGLNNTMAIAAVEELVARGATPHTAQVWDGGLPQVPTDPFGYQLFFHIEGLTNEYDGMALVLRDGRVQEIETLTELEFLEFEELGTLEAFVTSGGTSTVPYTMEGKLEVYENKTLRYPGHYAAFKAFKDLGLFSRRPIGVEGTPVVPRDVYHALLSPRLEQDLVRDVCVIRAEATGTRDGEHAVVRFELIDRFDEETGFSAMERLTGWHAAIVTEMVARGEIRPGVHPLERATPQLRVLEEVEARGLRVRRT
jgi:lysine 6-dehydrogenase